MLFQKLIVNYCYYLKNQNSKQRKYIYQITFCILQIDILDFETTSHFTKRYFSGISHKSLWNHPLQLHFISLHHQNRKAMPTSCHEDFQKLKYYQILERFRVLDFYHTSIYLSLHHANMQGSFMDFEEKACITENLIKLEGQMELPFEILYLQQIN